MTLGPEERPVEPIPIERVDAAAPTPVPAASEGRDEPAPSDSGWAVLLRSLGTVVAPTTALTAVLYYFGWARATAQFSYFAVDQKELGLSTTDYLLRSIGGAFWPVTLVFALVLVALWLHSTVDQTLGSPRVPAWGARAVFACLVAAGLLLAIRGFTGIARPGSRDAVWTLLSLGALTVLLWAHLATLVALRMVRLSRNRALLVAMLLLPLVAGAALVVAGSQQVVAFVQGFGYAITPLSVAAAIALLSYAVHLSRRFTPSGDPSARSDARTQRLAAITQAIALLLIGFCLFWFVGDYAAATGRTTAYGIARDLDRQTGVVVYSARRLQITEAPGTQETTLPGSDSAYRFKYTGLRLLAQSKDRYFLLPEGWSAIRPVTIVLPDTNDLRVDLVRGR